MFLTTFTQLVAAAAIHDGGGVAERLAWIAVSVVMYVIGGKAGHLIDDAFTLSKWPEGWHGWSIATDDALRLALFAPKPLRDRFHLLVGVNSYHGKVTLSDGKAAHGDLFCATNPKTPAGIWTWEPTKKNPNLPCLTITFNNGEIITTVMRRAV